MTISIGSPYGPQATSCGYCGPPGTRSATKSAKHSAGLQASQLTCEVYNRMMDRGWRRAGKWCYKPDLKASCCPSYTIRLDALAFNPSPRQRKLISRWNRFIAHGKQPVAPAKTKTKGTPSFSLRSAIHASEVGFNLDEERAHQFETVLEPSAYSREKFELYCKYQRDIHRDTDCTVSGFKRFLVDSPLCPVPIPYSSPPPSYLPDKYGSYHQLYRCDGKLIAMAVLDILPNCVSSVYFMYDQAWEEFSLGKLSALREVSLASEMQEAGAPEMGYLYMGFYIHSCTKMRYKGEYSPSYLADPETYAWFPIKDCAPLLEKYRYACFSDPDHSMAEVPNPTSTSGQEPPQPSDETLDRIHMVVRDIESNEVSVVSVNKSPLWMIGELRREILGCIMGLGDALAMEIIFYLDL
ncbi:arginine-tRNA-protein transferase [Mycena rebaudengoi]|nr:arginine-tRNA-protein transferase [Mycena rebaudengoi]